MSVHRVTQDRLKLLYIFTAKDANEPGSVTFVMLGMLIISVNDAVLPNVSIHILVKDIFNAVRPYFDCAVAEEEPCAVSGVLNKIVIKLIHHSHEPTILREDGANTLMKIVTHLGLKLI